MNYNIASPFFDSAQKHPQKLALFADGRSYSYRELHEIVCCIANWLMASPAPPKRIGILASRSMEACAGILAAACVGAAYVPISLKQPESGILTLLKRSGLDALVTDRTGSRLLTPKIFEQAPQKILCVRTAEFPGTGLSFFDSLPACTHATEPVALGPDEVAYILYTSGSTGVPKGVMLPALAVAELLEVMERDYPLSPADRVAETTDITFDLSVYNMFATWRAAASLHVIPNSQAMAPAHFIRDQQISVWLSVPSISAFMSRVGLLKPGSFPSLRYSFFCGEPLLASLAKDWQAAATNSVVVNMYGPTEAAVMCIGQPYCEHSPTTRDCVAIGRPFSNMQATIAKNDTELAPSPAPGELLLAGSQLAIGYLDDAEKTAARFVTLHGTRWYRTGDLARYDENGVFHYLGRIDNQVKILGYRIELEEVECHLRDATGCRDVAVVAWPLQGGSASGLVGFVVNYEKPPQEVRYSLQETLPSYMVPSVIHAVRELPLNNNGKVDRNAIVKMLSEGKSLK